MTYRARTAISYPDAASLVIVRRAGGLSRVSASELFRVTLIEVKAGERCDGLPDESVGWLVAQGLIEPIADAHLGAEQE